MVTPEQTSAPAELGDLFHTVFRRLRRRWSDQLAPVGLSPHQFRALSALAGHHQHGVPGAEDAPDGGGPDGAGPGAGHGACEADHAEGLRVRELAEHLRIAPRSATEVVDQLEAKGLVERRPDPADRRALSVRVTEAGASVRRTIMTERRRQAGDFFSTLEPADRVELARLLERLLH